MNANTAKAVCKGKKRPRNTHEILGCRHKLSLHVFKLCFVFQLVPRTNVHQCVAIVGVVWVETGMCLTYTPSSNVIKSTASRCKDFFEKKKRNEKDVDELLINNEFPAQMKMKFIQNVLVFISMECSSICTPSNLVSYHICK